MTAPSRQDLTEISRALALGFTPERLEEVLPEVQRLWHQARQLREVLVSNEEPATRFAPE